MDKSNAFACVLSHYGLFRSEKAYKVICPFHGDLNPSMQIDLDREYFYCYGCGAHGSTYELVKGFEPELNAIEVYKKISNIVKNTDEFSINTDSSNTTTYKRLNYAEGIILARDYYYNLPETKWYRAKEEAFGAKHYMLKRGFTSKTLINSGAKATYNVNYPIIFPLLENGIFRGYVMRTNNPEVESRRKYMYNSGFRRRSTLAGHYVKEQPVLIVEGFLDCLAARQLGVKNVVAILGWKISAEQVEKLRKKNIRTIICGLDNDEVGNNGYAYLKRIAKVNNFTIKRIRYPKHIKDFGDLLKDEGAAKIVMNKLSQFDNVLRAKKSVIYKS